jgi:NDP-sugar pyrophosphorylase family protein
VKRAVVLAGGEGTRLRPYTTVLPKPLMPIADRPVLDIVMRQLHRDGYERVTIATGYLAELIETFFGDGSQYGLQIDYHRESEPLGTAGALALIDGMRDEDVLVMNGDTLTDIDYSALLDAHRASDAAATIATTKREVQVALGVPRCENGDPTRLTSYTEKPILPYDASMGIYCFSPRVLDFIEPGKRLDFPQLVMRLIAADEVVRMWRSDNYWLDIGRHDDYERAVEEFEQYKERLLPAE